MSKCRKTTKADAIRAAEKDKGSKLSADERRMVEKLAVAQAGYVCGRAPRRARRGRR